MRQERGHPLLLVRDRRTWVSSSAADPRVQFEGTLSKLTKVKNSVPVVSSARRWHARASSSMGSSCARGDLDGTDAEIALADGKTRAGTLWRGGRPTLERGMIDECGPGRRWQWVER